MWLRAWHLPPTVRFRLSLWAPAEPSPQGGCLQPRARQPPQESPAALASTQKAEKTRQKAAPVPCGPLTSQASAPRAPGPGSTWGWEFRGGYFHLISRPLVLTGKHFRGLPGLPVFPGPPIGPDTRKHSVNVCRVGRVKRTHVRMFTDRPLSYTRRLLKTFVS